MLKGRPVELGFKARYGQPLHACVVRQAAASQALQGPRQREGCSAPFRATKFSCYPGAGAAEDAAAAATGAGGVRDAQLLVQFQQPMRAITPGQVSRRAEG